MKFGFITDDTIDWNKKNDKEKQNKKVSAKNKMWLFNGKKVVEIRNSDFLMSEHIEVKI